MTYIAFRGSQEAQYGSRLAADTMAEIPDQVLAFFASRGIVPNAPRPAVPLAPVSPAGAYGHPPSAPAMGGGGYGGAYDPPPPYSR